MFDFSWISYENPVAIWWVFLVSVSGLNILFWLWTLRFQVKRVGATSLFKWPLRLDAMIWLSGLYVFGCAFRSLLPRADVQRIVLFDTWLSSVLVGRTVATIAEMAFVTQWALLLYYFGKDFHQKHIRWLGLAVVPIIFVAECFSWFAVITTNYLGNAVEESLWAFTYTLIGLGLLSLRKHLNPALKSAASVAILGCILYVLFMVTVDVPMYVTRFISDSGSGKIYFGLFDGLNDLNSSWYLTRDIADWRDEIAWKSLYFSFAVWVSIALCYVNFKTKKS